MDRRTFIGTLAALPSAAHAAETLSMSGATETVALWPGAPPGRGAVAPVPRILEQNSDPGAFHNRVLDGIAEPKLHVVRPARPNGSALLVVAGGGYTEIWIDNEGFDVATKLAADGVTCFVLEYRLPAEGWLQARDVPLQDAQRAMRLIRTNAAQFGIDAAHIGAIGFSAGGHLVATLATRFAAPVYERQDQADDLSARPDFAALFYPVITMQPPFAHGASREMLLGANPSAELQAAYSSERFVTADTPPTFLVHALDDDFVSPDNTLLMLSALRAKNIPSECHLYGRGGHGFGIRGASGLPVAAWPEQLQKWGESLGHFRSA